MPPSLEFAEAPTDRGPVVLHFNAGKVAGTNLHMFPRSRHTAHHPALDRSTPLSGMAKMRRQITRSPESHMLNRFQCRNAQDADSNAGSSPGSPSTSLATCPSIHVAPHRGLRSASFQEIELPDTGPANAEGDVDAMKIHRAEVSPRGLTGVHLPVSCCLRPTGRTSSLTNWT